MKPTDFSFKWFAVWIALCAAGGVFLDWVSGMSFWVGAAIVAASLAANAAIAEVEDRSPGGFLNPKGKAK